MSRPARAKPAAATPRLEDDSLWQLALSLTDQAYALADQLDVEDHYALRTDLRDRGYELGADIAQALGSTLDEDIEYYYAAARRGAYALKHCLYVLMRLEAAPADPACTDQLDELVGGLEERLATVSAQLAHEPAGGQNRPARSKAARHG